MNDENLMNRLHNTTNRHQGDFKRVLCVCSAGVLRSPTAAVILSQPPYNYNTRAVGMEESYALIPIDQVHVEWAQEIVVMSTAQKIELIRRFSSSETKRIIVLNIPDSFAYRDPALVEMIKERYNQLEYSE